LTFHSGCAKLEERKLKPFRFVIRECFRARHVGNYTESIDAVIAWRVLWAILIVCVFTIDFGVLYMDIRPSSTHNSDSIVRIGTDNVLASVF
jgi:hypothetical protein